MTIGALAGWAAQLNGHGASFENGRPGPPWDRNLSAPPLGLNLSVGDSGSDPLGNHTVWEVVLITLVTGSLSLVTVVGNVLVVLSFKVNKQLRTVNNYFLLSLAFADLIIGTVTMNLYTSYIVMGRWALGNMACDLWLALDYVASNASVMNLLLISFDRYFSVTRPLTYMAKRTPRRAAIMIGLAWTVSFVLWAPAILLWQYIVGQRTVQPGSCSIQFLSEPIITFGTAIAAFYLPITIMTILYWCIYTETKRHTRELAALQGTGNTSAKWLAGGNGHPQPLRGPRPLSERLWGLLPFNGSRVGQLRAGIQHDSSSCESSAHGGSADSLNTATPPERGGRAGLCRGGAKRGRQGSPAASAKGAVVFSARKGPGGKPESVQLQETSLAKPAPSTTPGPDPSAEHGRLLHRTSSSISRSLKDEALADYSTPRAKRQTVQRKRRSIIKEKKAAKTLCAILLAFIITWTPYNIMVLVSAFCNGCVPALLWQLGYWLCYVNSTVNPMCYALCNREFRVTFKMLLLCWWDKRKWPKKAPPARQATPS
uniref:muscarinic acetylcholine receptor M1-like n=1 Tax=Pristiophorus japonicus TaxID=55135 RepID=UPI00398F3D01